MRENEQLQKEVHCYMCTCSNDRDNISIWPTYTFTRDYKPT